MRNWRDWRNDLLASPRFQAFAARFPLTRPITTRRAREAFDLAAGFVYTQILHACVELDLFEHLRAGPLPLGELAARMSLPLDGAERLLRAAVALKLIEARGAQRFGLGPHGAALLGNSGALSMVRHHRILYEDLADPVGLLRGDGPPTRLSRFWAYARGEDRAGVSDAEVSVYSALMTESQTLVRSDILDAISLKDARQLVDIGGGEGAFAAEAAKRWPQLNALVFDLPAVAARARSRFEQLGLAARATAKGGDFYRDELPAGADVMTLVRVLHDHDDSAAQALLQKIQRSLAPGGRLVIAEPMAGTKGAEAMGDAYFGIYLLAMGSGRPRPVEEILTMLHSAGFASARTVSTPRPMLVSVIVAIKA